MLICVATALAAAGCGGSAKVREQTAEKTSPVSRPTPYQAALAFAICMRKHGVPHPDPDRPGDFDLTPEEERLMRRATPRRHELAERACFHYLRGTFSTKPLSRHARSLAGMALLSFSRCMRGRGYDFYRDPIVRNMSRGRAFFGFEQTDPRIMKAQRTKRFLNARTACEKGLNKKLDRIIKADRGEIPA